MSFFKGAEYNASTMDWDVTREQHPDIDLKDVKVLRERSHQLVRDNLVVSGMQQTYINQIAGTGPVIYSASLNKIQREQINLYLKERLAYCDPSGSKSIQDIVEELVSCSFADGDVGINLPMVDGQTIVELVEAFRIDTPSGEFTNSNIRHGVQYANGKITGYHVQKSDDLYHYGSRGQNFNFFPVWNKFENFERRVFHLFKAPANSRPLASRQYPLTTPLIPFVKHLADYEEAVIVGARVAACFAGFIETENPAGAAKSIESADPDPRTGSAVVKIRPGVISSLKKGQKISFSDPNRPSDNHDAYVLRCYKTISMAYRIPYIVAFQDTAQTSYSSYKGAILDTSKLVGRWRRKITEVLLWIVNTFILEGIAEGSIRGTLSTAKIRVRWPSMGALDAEKEARGNKIAVVENKTKSRQMVCDEENIDFDELEDDLLEEALKETDRQAAVLIRQKEWEEKSGIMFPETAAAQGTDTSKNLEDPAGPSDETKRETRKSDGNW